MVIERMICLSNGSTTQPVVMRQSDYNAAEIRLLVYETPTHLLDMTGMAAVVIYEVDGVPTDPYEAKVEDKHWLHFTPPATATEQNGNGRMQIGIYLEDSLTHSYMLPYEVEYSLPMPLPGTESDPAPAFFSLIKEAREAIKDVKDGSYYYPTVDDDGTLSWAGSDDDMPAVPTTNIKGERGEDGATPIINSDGNWEIGGEDTGVKADWSADQSNAAESAKSAEESADRAAASATDAAKSAEDAASGTSGAIIVDDMDPSNIVHITDARDRHAIGMVTNIEPYQDGSGDPSPDNVRPIRGWDSITVQKSGKNILFNTGTLPLTRNGVTFADAGNGKISVSGTATANANYSIQSYSAGNRRRIEAGTYTLTGGDANVKMTLVVYATQESSASIASATSVALTQGVESVFTVPVGGGYFGLYATVSNGKTADCVLAPQVEVGSTASEYVPYNAEELIVALPETIYGGFLDWGTGVLTVKKGLHIFDGVNGIVDKVASNNGVHYASGALPAPGTKTGFNIASLMSDKLITKNKVELGCCYITGSAANVLVITLPDQSLTDLDSVNAWLADNPITFVYDLATTHTIQLTPQRLPMLGGVNNLWANCGKTKVDYIADTKKYIDKKFAALAAATIGV